MLLKKINYIFINCTLKRLFFSWVNETVIFKAIRDRRSSFQFSLASSTHVRFTRCACSLAALMGVVPAVVVTNRNHLANDNACMYTHAHAHAQVHTHYKHDPSCPTRAPACRNCNNCASYWLALFVSWTLLQSRCTLACQPYICSYIQCAPTNPPMSNKSCGNSRNTTRCSFVRVRS